MWSCLPRFQKNFSAFDHIYPVCFVRSDFWFELESQIDFRPNYLGGVKMNKTLSAPIYFAIKFQASFHLLISSNQSQEL